MEAGLVDPLGIGAGLRGLEGVEAGLDGRLGVNAGHVSCTWPKPVFIRYWAVRSGYSWSPWAPGKSATSIISGAARTCHMAGGKGQLGRGGEAAVGVSWHRAHAGRAVPGGAW